MSQDNSKNILETLLEGTDYSELLTEQQKEKITTLINETVDSRVKAKETLLTEEFEKKEQVLKAEVDSEKERLLKESEENEKILVEEAEKYKEELENTVLEKTKLYKENLEKSLLETADQYKKEIEEVVVAEATEYKERNDKALVEEVKKFKGVLIEKISDYIEAKLEANIPSEILESHAKLEVYEPLVKNIMESFSSNFIKLDDTSYQIVKESKNEIKRLEEELQESLKKNVTLSKEKIEVEKKYKIEALTEGLTNDQKQKARKLLEGYDLKELDGQFNKVRDIIIESNSSKKVEENVEQLNEETEKTKTKTLKEEKKTPNVVKKQQEEAVKQLKATALNEQVEPKKETRIDESQKRVNQWANKIQPKYTRG